MKKFIACTILALAICCIPAICRAQKPADSQILFVCEHGNVKSLMAASYFNQLAQQSGSPFHAVARGTAPNSTTVPTTTLQELRRDGVDVSSFHPSKVGPSDISSSERVITIGVTLPKKMQSDARPKMEEWNDVPPAGTDYEAMRASLKDHVKKLLAELRKR